LTCGSSPFPPVTGTTVGTGYIPVFGSDYGASVVLSIGAAGAGTAEYTVILGVDDANGYQFWRPVLDPAGLNLFLAFSIGNLGAGEIYQLWGTNPGQYADGIAYTAPYSAVAAFTPQPGFDHYFSLKGINIYTGE
jgi:hypothetical protein